MSQNFWGSGIQKQLNWVVVSQGLSWGCNQAVRWDCNHLKAQMGLKNLLPSSFIRLLADFSFSLARNFCQSEAYISYNGLPKNCLSVLIGLSQKIEVAGEGYLKRYNLHCFIVHSWKWYTFCHTLLFTQINPGIQ